jgi:capsular polysaccharide biosynthesis protein
MNRGIPEAPAAVSIADIAATVGRRWLTAGIVFLAVLGGSVVAGLLWPTSYDAKSVVAVSPVVLDPRASSQPETNIATEQVIVSSREVISRAVEDLGGTVAVTDLQERVSVTTPSDSDVLEITVVAETPDRAADQANAVAEGYLAYRDEQAASAAESLSSSIDEQIAALKDALDSQPTNDALLREMTDLRSQQAMALGTAMATGQIVEQAAPSPAPASPALAIFIGAGLFAGVLLGFGAALARDRMDRRIRTSSRLSAAVAGRVVDGADPSVGEHLHTHLQLLLARLDAASEQQDGPRAALVVATSGPTLVDFTSHARRGRASGGPGQYHYVVGEETGLRGVAQLLTSDQPGAFRLVVCGAGDKISQASSMIANMREWGLAPDLVVLLPKRGLRRQHAPATASSGIDVVADWAEMRDVLTGQGAR